MEGRRSTRRKQSEIREFEEARRCLLNLYHSNIQNHAGYLIAIIIGSLTLISQWDSFFSSPQKPVPPITGNIFVGMIITIFIVSAYFIIRLKYWTSRADILSGIRMDEIEELLEEPNMKRKEPLPKDVPYTLKLMLATSQRLRITGSFNRIIN